MVQDREEGLGAPMIWYVPWFLCFQVHERVGFQPFVFSSLSFSFAYCSGGIPNLFARLISLCFSTIFLEDVLRRIADFTEHQEDMKAKVIGAMAYPAVLAGLGTVILLVLILFFVPKFEQVFDRLKEKGQMPALITPQGVPTDSPLATPTVTPA